VRVLRDECVDARLAGHIVGFEVFTVHDRGWTGTTNGKLLALAQAANYAVGRSNWYTPLVGHSRSWQQQG
jgi:hypothetical protein